jgi:polar amino acid transport system substrate-binding protein
MTDAGKNLSAAGGHYAEPAIIYDNVLISLNSVHCRSGNRQTWPDYRCYRLSAPPNRYPDWLAQVKKQGRYSELNDQSRQVLMLSRSRVDLGTQRPPTFFRYFFPALAAKPRLYPSGGDRTPIRQTQPAGLSPDFS